MSETVKTHQSTGMEYYFFILRTFFGMIFFYIWSQSIGLFDKSGLDMFWMLFLVMLISGFIARVFSYLLLHFLTKTGKGILSGFWRLNFQPNINRISIVYIAGTALCCLIYAFGIDEYIIQYFFPNQTQLWSAILSYLFVKLGSQIVAWVFLKTRNV